MDEERSLAERLRDILGCLNRSGLAGYAADIQEAIEELGKARDPCPEAIKADLFARQIEDLQSRVAALEAAGDRRESYEAEQREQGRAAAGGLKRRMTTMRTNQCRRCSECRGQDHHWLENPDFGNNDDPDDPTSTDFEYVCKHCPARGGECPDCDGYGFASGEGYGIDADDTPDQPDCPRCQGVGIIDGLANTSWRD